MNRIQQPDLNRPKPVFFDDSGRRWKCCIAVLSTLGFILVASATVFVASLFHTPDFPPIKINDGKLLQQEERNEQQGLDGALLKTAYKEDPQDEPVAPNDGVAANRVQIGRGSHKRPMICGFYVPWDENSLASLQANSEHLTHIFAEWLILNDRAGHLQDRTQISVVDWARNQRLPILAEVTNFRDDQWRKEDLHQVLTDSGARRRLVINVVRSVRKYNLAGVNIDFEQVPPEDRQLLTTFVRDLHNSLAPAGLLLTEDLPTDDPNLAAYDMKALTKLNDYVIPMVYDEHFAAGDPGPIASAPWVRNQIREVLRMFPPEKTVLGLGNFGYDWTLGSKRAGVEVGFSDVISKAGQYHGTIDWHNGLRNSSLHYSKNGANHEVWFLDAVTALNAALEAHHQGFAGVSFWRLGAEDPGLWGIFGDGHWPADDFAIGSLESLNAIEGVRQYGRGDAIHVVQTKNAGWRNLTRDGSGFDEAFERLPSGNVVEGLASSNEKVVAVTFDDGPDRRYTPRILDVLKAKHVQSTFFVVGEQAERSPDLIRRIYAEGHDIGNHTYSHINEASATESRLALELNLTQRIIEHVVGHSTTLFRSPYNSDSDPKTSAGIQSVLRPQRLGYISIGEPVDPRDWESQKASEILKL
jgi:peptidoglycan-N-acetylglucosamine deacetylase